MQNKCPCEMTEVDIGLAEDLAFRKTPDGITLEGPQSKWQPIYCPICGRKLQEESPWTIKTKSGM